MKLTPSKIFLLFCLAIIGGIFGGWLLGRWGREPKIILIIICAVIALVLISVFWEKKGIKIIGFVILLFVLGIVRWEISEVKITPQHIAFHNSKGETTFNGRVIEEPDSREKSTKLTIAVQSREENMPSHQRFECGGKVLVTTSHYPLYHYGDQLKISCKLQAPEKFEGFDYPQYLSRFNIYSVCFAGSHQIKKMGDGEGNWFYPHTKAFGVRVYSILLKTKERVEKTISQILPEPQASLLAAIILGIKQGISQDLRDDFGKVGIAHIIAISGLHIMLLSSLIRVGLLSLGFRRKDAFYGASLFLILYIIFIGAPASAVRAGIMGFMVLLAQHLGRLSSSANSIVLAGTLMLLVNPKLLPYDVGFRLSFAAALGIIFIYPILDNIFNVIAAPSVITRRALSLMKQSPSKKKLTLTSWGLFLSFLPAGAYFHSLAMRFKNSRFIKNFIFLTLSAQITAFPLVAYHFAKLSLIAPFANILVVPLLPLIMILGFLSMILGSLYWFFGWISGLFVLLLLTYIIKLSHYLTHIPYAFLEAKMRWWMVFLYYLVLISLLVWYNRSVKRKT